MMKYSVALAVFLLAIYGVRCEYTSVQVAIADAPLKANELNGYRQVGNKYYYIERNEKVNWMTSWMRCRQRNGYLASPESAVELRALADVLKELDPKEWIWVDGTDLSQSMDFRWVTSGRPVGRDLFSHGEPNNQDTERCLHMWPSGDTFQLNNLPCESKQHFICQMQQPVMVEVTVA